MFSQLFPSLVKKKLQKIIPLILGTQHETHSAHLFHCFGRVIEVSFSIKAGTCGIASLSTVENTVFGGDVL